ncbi:hypothetical protein B6U84_04645, partial [Candidatus Bathyarchaeota archaeon ex4484_40]
MIDVKLIRENPALVRENLKRRGDPENLRLLEEFIEYDKAWRRVQTELNEARRRRNEISREIARLKKAGLDALLHESVPYGLDESDNVEIRRWGSPPKFDFKPKNHLEIALEFAIDFLRRRGYTLIEPPFMLRRKPYEGVTDLADFETVMYKIEGEDLYLIATS